MVKISSKNPYAFNGAPLPTELRQSFRLLFLIKFSISKTQKQFYIESYGSDEFSDSEIVASILTKGYQHAKAAKNTTLILINTCSIGRRLSKLLEKGLNFIMD